MGQTLRYSEFPRSVIEKVGYYVYCLSDPTDGDVFYVGKGTGNRVFAHANDALVSPEGSDKLNKIRQIKDAGKDVDYKIVRHGLTEKEAFEVESALIDFVGLGVLSNLVAGHQMARRGQMSIAEIIALYRAEKITINEPSIFVIVNNLFEQNITSERLYEITRGNWVMGIRREKAQYAFCVYKGLVREVYKINSWESVEARSSSSRTQKRWRFEGEVSEELRHYVGGSVEHYLNKAQSPVRYINC